MYAGGKLVSHRPNFDKELLGAGPGRRVEAHRMRMKGVFIIHSHL